MSQVRRQAQIDAPVDSVWDLVGNPARYPEWWPRVIEVSGESFEQGDEFVQVTRSPTGKTRSTFEIDRMEELREVQMTCTLTGMSARWLLTGAADGTFVEVEFGMDPRGVGPRVFDALAGRMYFSRWADQSLDGLRSAAAQSGAQAA